MRWPFAFVVAAASISSFAFASPSALAQDAKNAPGLPVRTPAPVPQELNERQAQVPFQVCPEALGKAKQKCPDCGGDTKIKGYCDTILLNGPQVNCPDGGCGTFCQCDPVQNENNGPLPTNQVPFQICQQGQKCSDCGGNDGTGHCRNILLNGPQDHCPNPGCGFYCACNDGSGSNGKSEIITTIINGQPVTATFTATTIAKYKDLRSATTVTTSEDGHETALAIFAGGVAWALANWAQLGAAAGLVHPEGKPDGSEEDDKACSNPKKECKDCGGANPAGLCSSGDQANCPCDDGCPTGDSQPTCSDQACKGDSNKKCTTGDHKGCDCKDNGCPEYILCDDCGGNDGKQKCKGISDKNNQYNGCDCYDLIDFEPEYSPFNDLELLAMDAFLVSLAKNGGNTGNPGTPRGNPSKDPKCATTNAGLLVGNVKTQNNIRKPKDLLYIMRETLCNNKCENPPDIPSKSVFATPDGDGCEIAISLPNNVEAWAYRGTHSQGAQQQDCWDSLMNATEKCTDYNPNKTGWVNGPDDYEFFQIGYRSKNGDGKKHSNFPDGSELPQYCPDNPKPKCDTCFGGASGNRCTQGENNGCDCEPVTATQPPLPKVTNCATAVAACEIICCGWSKDTQHTCSLKMEGCGVKPDLDAQCQSPVAADGSDTYSVCGQFDKGQGIVKGSHMEDISTCLDGEFTLHAEWKYA